MLTKKQKVLMYVFGIAALVLAIIAAIPFRTLTFFHGDNVLGTEAVLKFIVFPILVLGMAVYFNILKYKQINQNSERVVSINVMSYLPVLVYIAGVLLLVVHTLTFKEYPMNSGVSHSLLLAIMAVYFACVVAAMVKINEVTMSLPKKGNIILDAVVGAILVVVTILSWRVLKSYKECGFEGYIFKYGSNDDPFLFFQYMILLVGTIVYLNVVIKMIKADETQIYVMNPTLGELDQQMIDTFDDAYNDVLDEFEEYFDADLESGEVVDVEEPSEEAQPAEEAEPAEEAQPAEEAEPAEEAQPEAEEQPAEEPQPEAEEQPAEEAQPEAEEEK